MPDKEEIDFCFYVVAFIDILGQWDKLKTLDKIPENDDEKDEFIKTLKSTLGVVDGINKWIDNYEHGARKNSGNSILTAVLNNYFGNSDWDSYNVKKQRFSDGFVLFAPLSTKANPFPVKNLYNIMTLSSIIQLSSIASGNPVRGGIDVGVGVEYYPGELYGPVVGHAYKIESTVAQYPRMVVGDGLRQYINSYLEKTEDPIDAINHKTADHCRKMIGVDIDGCLSLDYLGKVMYESQKKIIQEHNLVQQALDFTMSEYEKFHQKGNQKLAARYHNLLLYLSCRSEMWGVTPPVDECSNIS
jgi:CRISPR/Cas system CMR-associated protein Cmr5 small subunit